MKNEKDDDAEQAFKVQTRSPELSAMSIDSGHDRGRALSDQPSFQPIASIRRARHPLSSSFLQRRVRATRNSARGPMIRNESQEEPMADMIRCTVPGCKKELPAESMWIPAVKALQAANGGRRVALVDFPKHALCGHHGHLLRQEGVRVYRYAETVQRESDDAQRRTAEALSFRHYAQRYTR